MALQDFNYILDTQETYTAPPPKSFIKAETKLEELKKIIKNENGETRKENFLVDLVECLKGFDEKNVMIHSVKESNFLSRISKWLLLSTTLEIMEGVKFDERIVTEYCRILNFAILRDEGYSIQYNSSIFPSKNKIVWKEMVNYCLDLIDIVDTQDKGMAIIYALYRFTQGDGEIKELIVGRREHLIRMMVRLTKFPNNQKLLTSTHSEMVCWTLKLMELVNAQKWNGVLESNTTLDKFQGFYFKALIDTLPERMLGRYYIKRTEPHEVITELFNMVYSCYLKSGDSVSNLFDDQLSSLYYIMEKGPIISIVNTILNRSDIEKDELVILSIAKSLHLLNINNINLCRLFSSEIASLYEKNLKQSFELNYSIAKLYASKELELDKLFETNEIRVFISNTILDSSLDHYMKIRTENDDLYLQSFVECFEAFGRSVTFLDKRLITFIIDIGDSSLIFSYLHRGGYSQIFSVFEVMASIIEKRGSELIKIMDKDMCHRLEKCFEIFITSYNDDGWFAVLCSAFENGLFWKIIEKSRLSIDPNFILTKKFKIGYTLELVKKVRQEREGGGQDPPFYILYCLWVLLMENIEHDNAFSRGRKNELYRALIDLSLIVRDYDCGNPQDSIFAFLFLAELEENIEENMNIILGNIDRIIDRIYGQFNRNTNFLNFAIMKLLENIERFLYHFHGRNILNKNQREKLRDGLKYLPTDQYPELVTRINRLI